MEEYSEEDYNKKVYLNDYMDRKYETINNIIR